MIKDYPNAVDEKKVGTYPALVQTGGGYVWDEVLEYRVWCHPEHGAEDIEHGSDYYYVFANYQEAQAFANVTHGAETPVALILQKEYIDEPEKGKWIHVKEERIVEWAIVFLERPKRTKRTIPNFLSPNAPSNKLDILRGLV